MSFRASSRETNVQVQPRSVIVFLDVLSDQEVAGWACDEGSPLQPVTLSLHIDDAFIQDFPCDGVRQDVLDGGFPTGSVGFSVVIPSRYCNDQTHVLELRSPHGAPVAVIDASGRGRAVREFRFPSTSVFGVVEGLHNGAITGWAFRHDRITDRRHGGLQVLVTCDGHPVGQVVANLFRPDVAEAAACDPNCGFQFVAPADSVGKPVELRFNVIPGGVELQNSPYVAEFPEPEDHRKLRQLQASADHILAQLATLRAQIDDLLPRERFSLQTYDRWARAYQRSLAAAALPPLPTARKGREPPLVTVICAARQHDCSSPGPLTGCARTSDVVAAVQSVVVQTYAKWELVLVGDGSPDVAECIADLAGRDPRIRAVHSDPNGGTVAGLNAALKSAKGRYVAFFGQDELMAPPALALMVEAALRTGAKLLYCDEDGIDDTGTFSDVRLKPDWNYRLLLAQDYVGSILFVERGHLRTAGPLRSDLDGAERHDLVLRLAEIAQPNDVHHVPEILCHRRKPAASAVNSRSAIPAGVHAVSDHLQRKGLKADVRSPRGDGCYEIQWTLAQEPKVSVIIPYREHIGMTRVCLDALRRVTDYRNYEIVLMDNWSVSGEAKAFAAEMDGQDGTRVVRVEERFNFARLNNLGAAATQGKFLLFMNNDVVVTQPQWLAQMVGEALADPLVAIVGNKLIYPNGLVQHGGLVLGVAGIAEHAHRGLPADHPGYMARAVCAQDLSAVTAACMLCRRDAFMRVAGFDESELPVSLNDVDLCLKIAAAGYRIVWTPASVAEHRESLSRGSDFQPDHQLRFFHETRVMQARWGEMLKHDRCYNRHFSRTGGIFVDLDDPEVSFATTSPAAARRG